MELKGMLREFLADLSEPDWWWQVLALVVCLGLAVLITRYVRQWLRQHAGRPSGLLARLTFPLAALALLLPTRAVLMQVGHVNMIKVSLPLLASLALIRGSVYVLRQAFSPSGWLAASERFLVMLVWGGVALHIVGLMPAVIDMLEQVSFTVGRQELNLWILLHGLFTVAATLLLALWLAGLIEDRLLAADKLDSSVRVVLARLAKSLLTLVAVLVSLSLVGIDVTTLSVFGGAVGVGLGFGLQKIASNYVSGFIILLDRSIRLGNVVTIDAQTSGVVTQITTRYTVLRANSGTEFIVPNEVLVAQVVHNQSLTDSRVFLKTGVQVSYSTDVEAAMALLVEIASAHPRVLKNTTPRAFLSAFADSGLQLDVGFWIDDPQEGTGNIISDINLAIWRAFKERGIEIPFPQREVRVLNAPPPVALG